MLTGERTNLRAIDVRDIDQIARWLDDPELMRWWGYGAVVASPAAIRLQIEDWIATERSAGHPAAFIIESLDPEEIGLIVLSDLQPIDRSVEISIFLVPEYRDRGLGSDALETLLDAAFHQWNLHRITAHVEEHNTPSQEFFLRNDFVAEGRLREARFLDGSWRDILIFGRLFDEETTSA